MDPQQEKRLTTTICFQTTPKLALTMRVAAAQRNQSKSAFIRDAIRHYIAYLEEQKQARAE